MVQYGLATRTNTAWKWSVFEMRKRECARNKYPCEANYVCCEPIPPPPLMLHSAAGDLVPLSSEFTKSNLPRIRQDLSYSLPRSRCYSGVGRT